MAHVHYLKDLKGERCACATVLGQEGYSVIAASGKAVDRALAMRVAARQERRTLIDHSLNCEAA
ncbi:MAG TPA: hypothetical protein VFB02_23665 [Bradyrhizobium sp.]|nr:hypothetical protein [Bradyrhizobium sp.]